VSLDHAQGIVHVRVMELNDSISPPSVPEVDRGLAAEIAAATALGSLANWERSDRRLASDHRQRNRHQQGHGQSSREVTI